MTADFSFLLEEDYRDRYLDGAGFFDMFQYAMGRVFGSYLWRDQAIIIRPQTDLDDLFQTINHEFIHHALNIIGEEKAMKAYDKIAYTDDLP